MRYESCTLTVSPVTLAPSRPTQSVLLSQATKIVAALARKSPMLQRFVHVSTAYVSSYMPKGSCIDECVRPLVGKRSGVINHDAVAQELASLSPSAADQQASVRHFLFCELPSFDPILTLLNAAGRALHRRCRLAQHLHFHKEPGRAADAGLT